MCRPQEIPTASWWWRALMAKATNSGPLDTFGDFSIPMGPPSCLHVVQDGQAVGAMQADKLLLGTKPWTVKSDGKASIATVMVDTSVSIST
jgi:hypothetical protein